MRDLLVAPMRGAWHLSPNSFYTRYIPGTNRLYERARLGCLPQGAGHGGADIDRDSDDKVLRAVWGGRVHIYGWDDFGNHLGVINTAGEEAFYAHLSQFHVKDGQTVTVDQDLGLIGATGQVTGEHCHFELREHATQWCSAVDPKPFLEALMPLNDTDRTWINGAVQAIVQREVASAVSAAVRDIVQALGWGGNAPGGSIPDTGSWASQVAANNIQKVLAK